MARLIRRPLGIVLGPLLLALALGVCAPLEPETGGPRVIDTGQEYAPFVTRLTAAITDQGMTVVAGACGKCGIETIQVDDPDALILTVSRPGLMLRMVRASAPAGADPPLRFYVSRLDDGTARLTYHRPSDALTVYEQPALDDIGRELDLDFARIVAAATAPPEGQSCTTC